MFRPASRLIARSPAARALFRPAATRRFLSTAPPSQKSRSWKSSLARWGAAGAIIYYYNTIDVFAEEPEQIFTTQYAPETNEETEQLLTIDALAQQRAKRKAEAAAMAAKEQKMETSGEGQQHEPGIGGVEELEEEAGQQGAFNPETGEINWDCPCLGGMATGPCGEQFKAAFSCFVYSTEEPKGMDCIDRFKDMQNCFREYPEIYGSELDIDEEDDVTQDGEQTALAKDSAADSASTPEKVAEQKAEQLPPQPAEREAKKERSEAATKQVKKEHQPLSESDTAVPKASHDATGAEQKN